MSKAGWANALSCPDARCLPQLLPFYPISAPLCWTRWEAWMTVKCSLMGTLIGCRARAVGRASAQSK